MLENIGDTFRKDLVNIIYIKHVEQWSDRKSNKVRFLPAQTDRLLISGIIFSQTSAYFARFAVSQPDC